MGTNQSHSSLSDCIIDENPISTTQDWTLHHAQNIDHGPLSVFLGIDNKPDSVLGALGKRLKQYRHPSILKFLAWSAIGGKNCLFTEKVCPLGLVRGQQTVHSIGLGLLEICQALQFMHQKGNIIHGNICQNAVFVTPGGRWKIGGLDQIQRLVDNNTNPAANKSSETSRDILALGLLITELLNGCVDQESVEFLEYVKSTLLLPDLTRRPTIQQVLNHRFFRQPYMYIFQFLKDITLKSEIEKEEFFTSLVDLLESLPGGVVGKHLTPLLLSRYVLMDLTARRNLVPKILQPKSKHSKAIFSEGEFKDFVVPEIRTMFLVYDTGIRLILLEHFVHFASSIDNTTLEDDILPSLLLGLRDSNPIIVSHTLRALADLVEIIGPELVIGKSRSKIFSDGSPNRRKESMASLTSDQVAGGLVGRSLGVSHVPGIDQRVPPIGAEFQSFSSPDEEWDNWEDEDSNTINPLENTRQHFSDLPAAQEHSVDPVRNLQSDIDTMLKNVQDLDILKLDLKTKVKEKDEVDFFADMTPDIPKKKSSLEKFQTELEKEKKARSDKFAPVDVCEEIGGGDGWGDEELDW